MTQVTSRPMTGSRQQNLLLMVAVLSLAATAGLFFAYLDQREFFYGRLSRGQMFGRDFATFWTASQLALADRIVEIFDAEAFHRALAEITGRAITLAPFPYPPHALVFFLPLGFLPYLWAFATWMIGLGVLYALVAARGCANANAYRALALLIAPSTVLTVTMGQNGFLSAILFVGGMNLLWRAPIWAGILFGLLTFKPQLGLLIPVALLAGCHWRAVASASATAAVLLGGSLIVDPLGQVLAGPEFDRECILTADLDLGDIVRGKYDLDVVGHYARPDVFRLIVNEKPMPAVVTSREMVSSEDDSFAETFTETGAED